MVYSKDTIKKMIGQGATDWEEVFASHISYKGLVSRIYNLL